MKKNKKTIIGVILMVMLLISIGMTVEAVVLKEKNNQKPTLFEAEIQFNLFEGYGCACTPVRNASILATSGEGNDHQYTNDQGFCTLSLVLSTEYRVTIEAEGFQNIIFDFYTVDDQYFIFHLEEKEDDSSVVLSSQSMLNKIIQNENIGE